MQKITPFLWFDTQAEEAMRFYLSVFKNSREITVTRYGASGPGPAGTVMTAVFELNGQQFTALNGGPRFQFTHAISFVVNCDDQAEVDYYWSKLSEGGSTEQCGWLKDKFGLSWQIVPKALGELIKGAGDRTNEVMNALLQMKKLDLATLQKAAAGGAR